MDKLSKREYDRRRYAANPEPAKARARKRYAENPEEGKARARVRYSADPERHKQDTQAWRERHPDVRRWEHLKARYKMTREDWETRLAAQGGVCAGSECSSEPTHVDHDHACCPEYPTCGKCVRGLLCLPCNNRDVLGAH